MPTTPTSNQPKSARSLKPAAAVKASAVLQKLESVVQDPFKLVMAAREGVGAEVAFAVADVLELHLNQLADLLQVSGKTLQNYQQSRKKLNAAQSEQTLKLLALHLKGKEVFGEATAFRRWLEKPAFGLDGQVPLTLLETGGGTDLVMEELERIAYGDLA